MKNAMFDRTLDAIQNWSRKGGYLNKSDAALCAIAVNLAVIADCLKESEMPRMMLKPNSNFEQIARDHITLADFLTLQQIDHGCPPIPCSGMEASCNDCWRKWLSTEVGCDS